jgi:hypothetical protein
MQFAYEPYVLRRTAEGRIFFVNSKMPFEYFVYCFQFEHPFFLISQLEDGRISITPNAMVIPWNLLQAGYWPQDLLPQGYEYVTMKHGTYPVIISAHPLPNFDEWYRRFVKCVDTFAKDPLGEFVMSTMEFLPLQFEAPAATAFPREKVTTFPKEKVIT